MPFNFPFYSKRFTQFILGYLTFGMILVFGACSSPTSSSSSALMIAAATSLTDSFNAIAVEFETQHPDVEVNLNFAASGLLQKQIEQGAPVDLFASASQSSVTALAQQNLLFKPETIFARNQLVVIVPVGKGLSISQLSDLKNVERLAIGNPATVPAGIYAKDALVSENLYDQLSASKKLILAENVRQVLAYVEQGNVDAAIVYKTDALISEQVELILDIPPEATTPIQYPIAIIQGTQNPELGEEFIRLVKSEVGQKILEQYGFWVEPS